MAAVLNLFKKHYNKKVKEWFLDFVEKTKEKSLDDLLFTVKRLIDAGSWVSLYNEYFQCKAGEISQAWVSLIQGYELSTAKIDIKVLLDRQKRFLDELNAIEEMVKEIVTVLYFASEIGHLHVKATGIGRDYISIPAFFEAIKRQIDTDCEAAKLSDKVYAFHSLHLSLYLKLASRLKGHIDDLRLAVPLESFSYDLAIDQILFPIKIKSILGHKRAFSLGLLSGYVKDKLYERHSHLTHSQYLDLKTGLKHPVIDAMFALIQNLGLNRSELYDLFHSGCERIFTSIHQRINDIYSHSATNKELNKELANYCWVSFAFIYDLQAQIDQSNLRIDINTALIEEQNDQLPFKGINKKGNGLADLEASLCYVSLTNFQQLLQLYTDFDTHKSFLSKRLFECFQRHLESTSTDKKLQFLKFFGAPDMRKTFKCILAYLTDRKIENILLAVIALMSHSNPGKARELLNINLTSADELVAYLEAEGLGSYVKYV